MCFKEIPNIKTEYDSLIDDIISDFYIPCLSHAVLYKRAVGFFSSNILVAISQGIGRFVENGGRIELLVSPKLEEEDYEAIKKGYDAREYLTDKIVKQFDFDDKLDQKERRFEMLSYMIESGILDVKIVALKNNNYSSMFHKKLGVMRDGDDCTIVFSGSGNETFNGYAGNSEDHDVFCSWKSDLDELRCSEKELKFDRIWNGTESTLVTIPFPTVIREKLLKYNKGNTNFAELDEEFVREKYVEKKKKNNSPSLDKIKLSDYQKSAIQNWKDHGYRGIFDMATGTGKTFAGAGAICKLFEANKRLITVVCCPYIHLIDQWEDELKKFNINAIKCYGDSAKYKKRIDRELKNFKYKRINFVCFIISNDGFQNESVQLLLNPFLKEILLIADEAHNFGGKGISKTMENDYAFRLALSATLDRHYDLEGTKKLYDFFGEKCIYYSLEQAIIDRKLTDYYYFPVIVNLSDDEYEEYIKLSLKIKKYSNIEGLEEKRKMLLLQRARIVAGAKNKIDALKNVISKYKDEHNMLVYCGAVKYGQFGYEKAEEEKKQIKEVLTLLNNDLHIYSTSFTSEEDAIQRREIINSFKNEDIQAMVAIKCLDEGVNIPAIKTAFILASSTNPKEYIQRRGRVLRTAPGKEFAEIYDFITLPRPIQKAFAGPTEYLRIEQSLVKKELDRLVDFENISLNPSVNNTIKKQIEDAYFLNTIIEDEDDDD